MTVNLGAGIGGGGVNRVRLFTNINYFPAGNKPIARLTVTTNGTPGRSLILTVDGLVNSANGRTISVLQEGSFSGSPTTLAVASVGQLGDATTAYDLSFSAFSGSIVHQNSSLGYSGNMYANLIAGGPVGGPHSGNFDDSFIVEGEFLGTINAQGYVNVLRALNQLGSTSSPATITAKRFHRIDAASFNGTISTTGTTTDDGIGQLTITGAAKGQITTSRIGVTGGWPGVWTIGGDLDADVTVTQNVDAETGGGPASVIIGGEFKAGRFFKIGGDLAGGAFEVGGIKVNTAGNLKGQVIVNANNSSNAWLGDVTVGSTMLDPGSSGANVAYATLPSTLGGGAVGHARFRLHGEACDPPLNLTTPPQLLNSAFCHRPPAFPNAYDFEEIVLVFYGGVRADHPTTAPCMFALRAPDRHASSSGSRPKSAAIEATRAIRTPARWSDGQRIHAPHAGHLPRHLCDHARRRRQPAPVRQPAHVQRRARAELGRRGRGRVRL
ncbi:MAG: hypothetical protein HBSAPP03_13640 [Phycisphaerae bacterium]|nr:MAG: hypothetical protein HBSAPP03_13640 [Phycisphaerae bacterium]